MTKRWTIKDKGSHQFCWVHLDGRDAASLHWLEAEASLPETARFNLTAVETRPRCQPLGEGAIINLRGPRDPAEQDDGDELVSIRIWAERGRVVSLCFRQMEGLDGLCERMDQGKFLDPGDLIAALSIHIARQLDPVVATLGDDVDDCEVALSDSGLGLRRQIAEARSTAIGYRRFVVPQRQALEAMSQLEYDWIEDDDRIHLREAADRFARMAEELEAIRERSALLHEQITDLRAEKIDRRSLIIAVVALIFLPLTFVTGLFGMNVEGIPYAHHPLSFWAVTGFSVFVGLAVAAYFVAARWFRN